MHCHQPTYCDVDDTLVLWERPSDYPENDMRLINCGGVEKWYAINWPQVRQLSEHKARGHTVIVWSAGGSDWADAVVDALEMRPFVDLTLEKPMWAYDDLPASEFMPKTKLIPWKKVVDKTA